MIKAKPDGYQAVIPYIQALQVEPLMEFIVKSFDANVIETLKAEDGTIRHAEVRIDDSVIMIGQSQDGNITNGMIYLYVPDVDTAYAKAIEAGATSMMEPADQFYGDRNAGVQDAFGQTWWLSAHIEDVSPEEVKRRMKEAGQ